jgi:hypothetical protein
MRKLLLVTLLLTVATDGRSQTSKPSPSILPEKFGSWSKLSCGDFPGGPDLHTESGLVSQTSCRYSAPNQTIVVGVQKFRDPTGAYEFYTAGLRPGMMASLVGNNAAVQDDRLWMLTGALVLQVDSQKLASEEDLRALVKSLDGHVDKTPLPDVRGYLPSVGLVQGTQRYSLGPEGYAAAAKALDRGAYSELAEDLSLGPQSAGDGEVMLAAYNNGRGGREVLVLAHYPTPQVAEQQLHHLQPLLASKPEFAGTTVERDASLLSLVLSPSSPEMAARLRKAIKYDTAVTWNEPSTTLTDPPWVLVLKTIFFAAFGFCVLAGVIGVLFGVFRLLMKRLFPGKIFDRTKSIELLQLGLNSKPVNPDDFY